MNTPSRGGVLLIDGRSGSGKTTLAEHTANTTGAQVLHVEELYPGWDGLAAGSAAVARALEHGRYHRYDWIAERFTDHVTLHPGPLIVEGCGALTRANLRAARAWSQRHRLDGVHGVWLELEDDERRRRALDRDGDTFAPHWYRWAAQEDAHFGRHRPWLLADQVRRIDDAL